MYANISFAEFLFSDSGHVKSHEGLALGWIAGALSGLAALLGTPNQADADPCNGIRHETCDTVCTEDCGNWNNWAETYCHHMRPNNQCILVKLSCGC